MGHESQDILSELEERLTKLEKRGFEAAVTLLEILSGITFFGRLKMEKCGYAMEGQCGLYILKSDAKKRIPIATDCKIKNCNYKKSHLHLELSNMVCAFCPLVFDLSEIVNQAPL